MIDPHVAYRAVTSRDPRFDGVFYVGVMSTGIYCRPVCPVKTPQEVNCRFFASAEAAEKASFRPCLRCRPELAPGNAPVDQAERIAHQLVLRMEEGLLDDGVRLEAVAADFGLSSRQLRRIVLKELGVSPIELLQTRRLLLAKQLLTETSLPVTRIAFASGFSSLRRFNDAFKTQYRMPPTRLRRQAIDPGKDIEETAVASLQLVYRPPYDWDTLLAFLDGRKIKDVEWVEQGSYLRTVRLGKQVGWIRVSHVPESRALRVEVAPSLMMALPALLGRLRHLFDLSARPDVIAEQLGKDPVLEGSVRRNPGLRVPGAFDGFELVVRAILGQQITVKAATTLSGRFADAFGEPLTTPYPQLTRLAPTPQRVARASVDEIARLGIVKARATTLLAMAQAFRDGSLRLDPGAAPEQVIPRLMAIPGIGPWTAHYIAMRALRWPDAFPKEDIAVRNALGRVSAKVADQRSQAWRPWRSYATLHLWNSGKPASSGSGSAKGTPLPRCAIRVDRGIARR